MMGVDSATYCALVQSTAIHVTECLERHSAKIKILRFRKGAHRYEGRVHSLGSHVARPDGSGMSDKDDLPPHSGSRGAAGLPCAIHHFCGVSLLASAVAYCEERSVA